MTFEILHKWITLKINYIKLQKFNDLLLFGKMLAGFDEDVVAVEVETGNNERHHEWYLKWKC